MEITLEGGLGAMGLAFLGGLLLNVMPCVFPVLSIKVLGFMQAARPGTSRGAAKQAVRAHGWWFALGVLASFWVLAGLLLAFRAAGEQMGWGFQLQSPAFVALLALLMFGLGLNLAGVFEMGTRLTGLIGKTQAAEGASRWETFASGVLATVLATPCTAPFMGTALGAAVVVPAPEALLIFTALGAGMATPVVALSCFPGLLQRLPKPGRWMETFKNLMAFPLFATVIWLMWVFGRQTSADGLLGLMTAMLLLAMGLWMLGHWNALAITRLKRVVTRSLALLLVGGALFVALRAAENEPAAPKYESRSPGATEVDAYGIRWEPYTEAGLRQHLANNRRVFIDFTADWCITCKVNERNVFSSSEVRRRLEELDIVMIKADWTRQNPAITKKLAEYNRNSVPLYLLYDGTGDSPEVLPQILTPGIVLSTLDDIAEKSPG